MAWPPVPPEPRGRARQALPRGCAVHVAHARSAFDSPDVRDRTPVRRPPEDRAVVTPRLMLPRSLVAPRAQRQPRQTNSCMESLLWWVADLHTEGPPRARGCRRLG